MLMLLAAVTPSGPEVATMRWEDLVCAACSGRVLEGRCPTCRAAREEMRSRRVRLPAAQLLFAAAFVLALIVVLTH